MTPELPPGYRTYPKIETYYDRGEDFKVDLSSVRKPEFDAIDRWEIYEKVDGTNIRITYSADDDEVYIGGRTDRATLPKNVLAAFEGRRSYYRLALGAIADNRSLSSITVFGEAYGDKIQKAGKLYGELGFVGFDVLVNEKAWLQQDSVAAVLNALDIKPVPYLGIWTIPQVIENVSAGVPSRLADIPKCEGIIARPSANFYDQRGDRVMWKLKTTDFHNPGSRLA
jgi:hypothetical protein